MDLAQLSDDQLEVVLKEEYLKEPGLTNKERAFLQFYLFKRHESERKRELLSDAAMYFGWNNKTLYKVINNTLLNGNFERIQDNARIRLITEYEDIKK